MADNSLAVALYGTDDAQKVFVAKCNPKDVQRRAFNGGAGSVTLTADECKKLCKACNGFEYLDGYEHRVIQYRVSDETVDRYGDIVRAKGATLGNYRNNPVVQFAHDYSQPNVGVSVKTWYAKDDACVYAWALYFDDRIDPTGRSDLIHRLAKANAMRACSVGFYPIATRRPDSEERQKLGMSDYGVVYETWDMMEFSPCPVPANPNALRDDVQDEMRDGFKRALRSGLFVPRDAKLLSDNAMGLDSVTLDDITREIAPVSVVVSKDVNEPEGEPVATIKDMTVTLDASGFAAQVERFENAVKELQSTIEQIRAVPKPTAPAGASVDVRKSLYDSINPFHKQ